MTFPKNHNSFSPVFKQMIEQAALRRIVVECDTPAQARSEAARMRAYVGQLFRAAEKNPDLMELANAGRSCMFRVDGCDFIAQPRDLDARFDRMRAALAKGHAPDGVPTMGAEAEESLARLQGLIADKAEVAQEAKPKKNPYF